MNLYCYTNYNLSDGAKLYAIPLSPSLFPFFLSTLSNFVLHCTTYAGVFSGMPNRNRPGDYGALRSVAAVMHVCMHAWWLSTIESDEHSFRS